MPHDKLLYLVRHAKSNWDDPEQSDFERPLNLRGRHDAPEMGRRLRKRGIRPERIVASPARRAAETAELIAAELGLPETELTFEPALYEATLYSLLGIVRSLEERFGSVMLVGHNPSMTALVNRLTGGHIPHVPTAGIATIRLAGRLWKNADGMPAELLDFDFPKNG